MLYFIQQLGIMADIMSKMLYYGQNFIKLTGNLPPKTGESVNPFGSGSSATRKTAYTQGEEADLYHNLELGLCMYIIFLQFM